MTPHTFGHHEEGKVERKETEGRSQIDISICPGSQHQQLFATSRCTWSSLRLLRACLKSFLCVDCGLVGQYLMSHLAR